MTNKPKVLMLNITERCNSRCLMCGTWRKKSSLDLRVGVLEDFLKKNQGSCDEIETVGLIGGEPFLAADYLNFIRIILKYCPKIKTIGQSTNSLLPKLYLTKINQALKIIPKNIFYGISVSLDGMGPVHDKVRGYPGAFVRANYFIAGAERLFSKYDNFYLSLTATVSKDNLNQIDKIIDYAKRVRLRFTFRPAMEVNSPYINNAKTRGWQLQMNDKKTLQLEFNRLFLITKQDYYQFISALLAGEKRTFPCPFQKEGLVINPDEKIYMCLFSDQGYLGDLTNPLSEIFGSPKYLEASRNLIRKVCPACSAECYTSRSSAYKNFDFMEEQLTLLLSGKIKKFTGNLAASQSYIFHNLLKEIANFKEKNFKENIKPAIDEEKIILNTWLGREKYKLGAKSRNGFKLDFKQKDFGYLLLNFARYYYIIKMYSKAQIYINLIKKFLKSQPEIINSADKLEMKIKFV